MATLDRWLEFFESAGLQPDAANTYAHSFTENRIQLTMLQDLNKEYLRDLGVYRTGDIILVLKAARKAQEEGAFKRTRSRSRSPMKASKRRSVVAERPNEAKLLKFTKREQTPPPPAPKIKAVKEPVKKVVLTQENGNKSIFHRLGSKAEEELAKQTKSLKVSPTVVSPRNNQRVLFVKKIPAKAAMPQSDSEDDDAPHSNNKTISFSRQDEVMEFAARKPRPRPQQKLPPPPRVDVRARLGESRSVSLKPQLVKHKSLAKTVSLKSDEIMKHERLSVHDRITLQQKQVSRQVDSRSKHTTKDLPSFRKPAHKSSNGNNRSSIQRQGSVFERLGINRK